MTRKNQGDTKISKDSEANVNIIEKAIFSSQYKRKIYIKYWLFTKKGFATLLIILFFYFFDLLNTWTFSITVSLSLYLYLKDDTLLYTRDNSVWLLKEIRLFILKLENIRAESHEKKATDEDIKRIIKECTKK